MVVKQVLLALKELMARINLFDARFSYFSTTLGFMFRRTSLSSSSGVTPLKVSVTVKNLEKEVLENWENKVVACLEFKQEMPLGNYEVITFHSLLWSLKLLVSELRTVWDSVTLLLQIEALHSDTKPHNVNNNNKNEET